MARVVTLFEALTRGDVARLGDTYATTRASRIRSMTCRAWRRVRGGSHLVFAADGRIEAHRDYWDAAEELYEKLPVLGTLLRWLRGRMSA